MSSPLGKEIFDISIAEREPQVEPDGMLDDNRRKSVTAVGDSHNPTSLLASSLPCYPVILTRPVQAFPWSDLAPCARACVSDMKPPWLVLPYHRVPGQW